MFRAEHVGVIQHRDLLLRVVAKSHHSLAGAQIKMRCKGFERGNRVAFAIVIRSFDDHHGVGVHRAKDNAQSLRLLRTRNVVARRPATIHQKRALVVEQAVHPFDVVGGKAHQAAPLWMSSHARLMSTKRLTASCTASSGTPRATIASGWFSRTSLRHAARMSSAAISGVTPKTV